MRLDAFPGRDNPKKHRASTALNLPYVIRVAWSVFAKAKRINGRVLAACRSATSAWTIAILRLQRCGSVHVSQTCDTFG